MLLAVRISSYGCTLEVWRALNKLACEYGSFSLLLAAEDVSSAGTGRTSATQRQKFHTDDVNSVRNLVRSYYW